MQRRFLTVLGVASALSLILIVFLVFHSSMPQPGGDANPAASREVGGPFTLVDQTGATKTERDFHGGWTLVFFGFTHCPDMCPTGLNGINEALKLMGPDAQKVRPLFITLDPARDTPAVLRSYLAAFSPRWVGLTGTQLQVDEAAGAYRVYHARQDLPESELGYTINHSGFIYLMGPDGLYRAHFRHDEDPKTMAAAIARKISDD